MRLALAGILRRIPVKFARVGVSNVGIVAFHDVMTGIFFTSSAKC